MEHVEHGKKMKDMGEKMGGPMMAQPEKENRKEKSYPTLYLSDQLPGLEDYDVGDEVCVMFHAKLTHKSESEGENGESKSFTLELKRGQVEAM